MKTKTTLAAIMALFFALSVSAQNDMHHPVEKKDDMHHKPMHKPYHKPVHRKYHHKKKVMPKKDMHPQDEHHVGQR